jgi:hypothetical protein
MGLVQTGSGWQRAALATHTGYDDLPDGMVQDLAWEQLPLPVTLADPPVVGKSEPSQSASTSIIC